MLFDIYFTLFIYLFLHLLAIFCLFVCLNSHTDVLHETQDNNHDRLHTTGAAYYRFITCTSCGTKSVMLDDSCNTIYVTIKMNRSSSHNQITTISVSLNVQVGLLAFSYS